jgi:DNA-binding transcriptional ArsR family regulator
MKRSVSFKNSDEAAFRRVVRDCIAKGPFTKSQRDVTKAFFEHWFYHKSGPRSYVHPGREKIAKRAKVDIKTVSRTLAMLRAAGIIEAIEAANGQGKKPTKYVVNVIALFTLCGAGWAEHFVKNVPPRMPKMSHQVAGQNVPQIKDTNKRFPSQDLKLQSGGQNA